MDVLEGEARAGKTVIASTHDLMCAAQRFQRGRVRQRSHRRDGAGRDGPRPRPLSDTYGGHVLILPGGGDRLVLDDAHHHDQEAGREQHFHEGQ